LSLDLQNTNLGLVVQGHYPDETDIKNAIKRLPENKSIDINQIKVTFLDKDRNSANISVKNDSMLYGGDPIKVTFLIDLHVDLTNTNLGIINSEKEPTGNEILKALGLAKGNENLDISQLLAPKLSAKPGEATIIVKSDSKVYAPAEIKVSFDVPLDSVIKLENNDLGLVIDVKTKDRKVAKPTEDIIKNMLAEKYKTLKIDFINITIRQEGGK